MRKLTSREHTILIVTIIMIAVYVLYHGVAMPLRGNVENLEQMKEVKQRELRQKLKTIQQAERLSTNYQDYLAAYKQTKSNEEVMSSILAEIELIAKELNMGILNLKPKRVQRDEFYNRFSVTLTNDSEFDDVLEFHHILQTQPHLFDIEQISFDKGSRRNSTTVKTELVLGKILIPNN